MRTVIGQIGRFRVREAIGSVRPRQRVGIDGIVRSGFVIVEVEALEYLEMLLYIIIGDDGTAGILQFRSKHGLTMVKHLVTAYIEPIISSSIFFILRTYVGRFDASCA